MSEQEMREISVEKVVVNFGAGEVGDAVEQGVKLLRKLTGTEPVRTESGDAAKGFGLRDGLQVGAKVTLRGEAAEEFVARVLEAKGDELPASVFDTQGNFSVGVDEYINMPGVDYDPEIGMKGFEVAVVLERPGFRTKKRKEPNEVGQDHRITAEEAQDFVRDRFGADIV